MFTSTAHWIQTYLDPIGIVVGLLLAVPVIWTWVDVVFGGRRRRKRIFNELRRRPGERPAILILDLLTDKSIRPSVETWRQGDESLKAIPDERIFYICRNAAVSAADMPALHQELRETAGRMLDAGVDVVHFVHAGPAVVAALVGAELANTTRVLLYQRDQQAGSYANFGPLRLAPMQPTEPV